MMYRHADTLVRGFALGMTFLLGAAVLPRTAGASPAYVPKHLRAEHQQLPRQIRHPVEVYYYKLRQFGEYLQKGDEPRTREALKEAGSWWQNAMRAAGPDAMTTYPILKKHHEAILKARRSLASGLAAVEKTGCPKDKYRNGGLKRVLRGPLLDMFDRKNCGKRGLPSQQQECRALREKLKKFSLTGRPTTKYNAYRRTYTERVVVWACVRQQRPGQKEICRALQVSVQRTKVKGRRWSPWKTYGVGSVQRIGCRALK